MGWTYEVGFGPNRLGLTIIEKNKINRNINI